MSNVYEILKAAEDNIESIKQHVGNKYLRNLMEAAYLPEKKLQLPEGTPPFTPNSMEQAQVEPGVFWQICKKLDVYQRKYEPPTSIKIETSFIQALETLSKEEAEILLAVKEQKLHKLLKGVTLAKLQGVGYFP